jgi:hypothetical protein
MFLRFRQSLIVLVLLFVGILPLASQTTSGGDHVVPAPDLHQAVRAASQVRQDNLGKLDKFFTSEPAKKAFAAMKLDSARVSQAVSLLSDEELARLASQSDKIQNDVAAGALTNQQITYILIALATAVIILVIVAAR